jgi:hypothetical protein
MHFNALSRLTTFIIFLFLSIQVLSEENKQVELSIKPLACIVKNVGESCKMTIIASWQSEYIIDSCLYQGKKNLSCWEKQKVVSQQFNIELSEDMVFSLKDIHGKTFAQQVIHLNTTNPRQYRRRLKAEWSLF